jgi:hypothetical protein
MKFVQLILGKSNRTSFRWQPALTDTAALTAHKLRANQYS